MDTQTLMEFDMPAFRLPTASATSPEPRPLCEHCAARPAKPARRFCNTCYRQGFCKADWVLRRELGFQTSLERPADLADTGLRIDDENNVLIHPDGRQEQPVPTDLIERFFFEPVDEKRPNLLRVLRKAARNAVSGAQRGAQRKAQPNTQHEETPCLA